MRIASMLASGTEIVCGLGSSDQLVAISHECDYPPQVWGKPRVTRALIDDRASSQQIDAQVKQHLAAGAPLYEIDEPLLARLQPDVIVTQAQCDVCAIRYEDVLSACQRNSSLQQTHIVALNPATLEDILSDIQRVGETIHREEASVRYRRRLEDRVAAVAETSAATTQRDRPRVTIVEWTEPLLLAGNWMPGLVETAGGRHDLTTAGEHSPYIAWQQVVDYDPEVVIIAPCGFDLARSAAEAITLSERPHWREIAAVRAGRVFAADGNAWFNRSGPRMVDTLEFLAHLIQPEHFGVPECIGDPAVVWQRIDAISH